MVDLQANPFFLNEEQCKWVRDTLASMSLFEKTAQLFFSACAKETNEELLSRYESIPYGGIMFRGDTSKGIRDRVAFIQSKAKIPMLISANLESGGSGIVTDGTDYGNQLQVAATNDVRNAEILGDICGAEGSAVGANYAFAPVVDVQMNWRNPIINTRTYGSDPQTVLDCSSAYIRGIRRHNVAVSIKHFPGDGVDERDQHLLSAVNTLSCEQWDSTFGRIYKTLIDEGAQTVMVGHILLPAYSRRLRPGIRNQDIRPASLAPELVTGLLRGQLGFNGMIITDSATMTGLGCALPRRQLATAAINAGCDMFLFGRNLEEDFSYVWEDVQNGTISIQRLDEAVTRVLALKASLNLHIAEAFVKDNYSEIVGCARHKTLAKACADQAITLVKDTQKLLPISPATHKRIWLHVLGDNPAFRGGSRCKETVIARLQKEGFEVTCLDGAERDRMFTEVPVKELKARFDLILYIANMVTGGNNTTNRLFYAPRICGESPQHVMDIPTMFVSLGDPFHFVDVPMIRTFINCYNHSEFTLDALMDKITGRSAFKGVSPVDPFCGVWGADL